MYHKIIDNHDHDSSAAILFREQNIVDLALLATTSETAQFDLLTEVLHTVEHRHNKILIKYMAQLALRIEHYDTAVMYLLKLLPNAKKRNAAWAYKQLGVAFWGKQAYSLALDYFKQAVELNPADGDIHNYLGKLYNKRKELELALYHFQKMIELTGGDGAVHRQIGFVYMKKCDYKTAVMYFKKALVLDPEQALSYYGYGFALFRLGAYRSALKKFHVLFKENKLLDKAALGFALVLMAKHGYAAGKAKLQEIPWYDPQSRYIENIPLAGTMTAHARSQATERAVNIDIIRTSKNIGIVKNNIAKLYPFTGNQWTRYEVVFDMRNNATMTVINYTPEKTTKHERKKAPSSLIKRLLKILRSKDIEKNRPPA